MNTLIKKEFNSIVGDSRFRDRLEDLLSYSYDAFTVESVPDLVLLPVSTAEISAILKVASEHQIPVTARGAGSSGLREARGIIGYLKSMSYRRPQGGEIPCMTSVYNNVGGYRVSETRTSFDMTFFIRRGAGKLA